tara:strand:+ start:1110 stop:1316 length:207 start_codon:yes stop_codon:yes gene_type:complete
MSKPIKKMLSSAKCRLQGKSYDVSADKCIDKVKKKKQSKESSMSPQEFTRYRLNRMKKGTLSTKPKGM